MSSKTDTMCLCKGSRDNLFVCNYCVDKAYIGDHSEDDEDTIVCNMIFTITDDEVEQRWFV